MSGMLTKIALGKYIQSLFPKAKAYKKWFPEDKRESSVYKCLSERKDHPDLELKDISVLAQWVPLTFFVCNNVQNKVEFAVFCDLINGNQIVKKISIYSNGKWQLHIGENKIDLEGLEIENSFIMSRNSLHTICSIVFKLITCKGMQIKKITVCTRIRA